MDKDDIYSIKEYLCQILKMIDETQDLFNMTVTINDINSKLDRMIEWTTDKHSHQSTKIKYTDQPTYKVKADNDKQLKQDDNKYIDEAIYSDIEGEPQSRFTYAEIQQMRRQQYEKGHKCQSDPSIILLESDLIKEAKFMDQLNKK